MKHVKRRPGYRQTIARDAHAPETVYVETETDTPRIADRNAKIRNERLMQQGQRLPGIDHSEVTASFQFGSQMEYQLVKAQYPEEFKALEEGGDAAIRAGERLAILIPEHCTMVRRGDRINGRKTM